MPRAGLTRDKIIEAAGRFADEHGLEALTMAELARTFAIRLPSLYAHVASADDLRQALALLALQRLAEKVEEAIAGRSRKDALVAMLDAYRDFARQHPGLFAAARYPLDPEIAATSGGARLARANHALLRGYDLSEDNRVHATRLIGAFALGFALLEGAGSFDHSAPDPEASWTRGVDGLDSLITSWA